ncbi:MAG TPA: ankyrin repeat domain-containing protein [Pirellulaceae bacterium]|jgi:ankyrin repeat protein|nr:ankyrin repeat domain-containing protein [Pirellulaceae bacterium]
MPRLLLFLAAALAFASGRLAQADEPSVADAAQRQELQPVDDLLAGRADVNAAQVDGMTALHWAVWHDDSTLVRKLLRAGAKATAANRYGVTPLAIACTNGNAETAEQLLDAGADADSTLRGGETALMTAARTGKLDVVHSLLRHGATVDAKERSGQTALMWAAADGHADVVQALIDAGADYRSALRSGFTPMLFAAREGRTGVVKVLLKAGVDANEVTAPERKTNGREPVAGTSPLILAIENGHFETALVLLKAGADPNDQRSGYTTLHVMTWVRKPNRGDGLDGEPPPRGSGALGSLDFVEKLVEHGADVNARLKKGSKGGGRLGHAGATPFLLASATTDAALMRKLAELGADPHLANDEKTTPLLAAAGVGIPAPQESGGTDAETIEALSFLLDLGCDIDAVDANGETAMHGAAYKMYPRVVEFLAQRGADPAVWNRANRYGWTPSTIASGKRHGNFRPSPETAAALEQALQQKPAAAPGKGDSRPF